MISAISGLVAIGGLVFIVAFRATRDPWNPAWILSCPEIASVATDGQSGSLLAGSAQEAVLKTKWLPAIGVPPDARHITTDHEPENGIVTVPPAADGMVTPNEREGGRSFKIYTNGEVTAFLTMYRTPNGAYKVHSLDHC